MNVRLAPLAALLLSISACQLETAEPVRLPTDAEVEQYNASVPPEERIVCREEKPVATYIARRVCRYASEMDQESRFTRSELNRTLR
ncbi:MAG: hypothetical protein AB8B95_10485 [Pseudohongiellaceae bacterium]